MGAVSGAAIAAGVVGAVTTLAARNEMQQMKHEETKLRNSLVSRPVTTARMPTIDTKLIDRNRARQFSSLQRRSGRASTLLTGTASLGQSNTFG